MPNKRRKVGRQPVWPTQKYRGGDPTRAARCCDTSWPWHQQKSKTFIAKASRAICFVFGPFGPSTSPCALPDSSRAVLGVEFLVSLFFGLVFPKVQVFLRFGVYVLRPSASAEPHPP